MRDLSALALSYFQQAATCYQQARYVEAIQHYLSGLKYDKSHYHVYADLAKAYEMVGKWEQALVYLDTALKLCPTSTTVLRRKARISEEKDYYQHSIQECSLSDTIPLNFTPKIQIDNQPQPKSEIKHKYFNLTVQPAVHPKTLWYICQLIEMTYHDVGGKLNHYPDNIIPISITNTNDIPVDSQVPKWASGFYDGQIHVNYCSDDEPELGVLYTLIRHEWTHLLVNLLSQGNCPIWLNEGLAQIIARPLLSYEKHALVQAKKNNTLPIRSELNQPFTSFSASERKIAYLQSAAIVDTLINEGGFTSIRHILSLLRTGTHINSALNQTYKRDVLQE